MRAGRYALLVVACLCIAWLAPAKAPRVSLYSPGRFATDPAEWWVRITVAPDASNRWLDVIADGTQMYRSTRYELSGTTAAKVYVVWFKGLRAGCYSLRAELLDTSMHVVASARAPWSLDVIGADSVDDTCE